MSIKKVEPVGVSERVERVLAAAQSGRNHGDLSKNKA